MGTSEQLPIHIFYQQPPYLWRILAQCGEISRARKLAPQDTVNREFTHDQIGRNTREIERKRFGTGAPLAGLTDFVINGFVINSIEIAVVHIHVSPLRLQSGATVEHAAFPATDLGNLAGPTKASNRLQIERVPMGKGITPTGLQRTELPLNVLTGSSMMCCRIHSAVSVNLSSYVMSLLVPGLDVLTPSTGSFTCLKPTRGWAYSDWI